MIVLWKIRYLDRNDRQFKDRNLFLDTTSLPPAQRAAVELAIETDAKRKFLQFRSIFQEDNSEEAVARRSPQSFKGFCVPDYCEDESGVELSMNEVGQILTGSPTAISVPAGTEQHHIDYILTEPTPVPIAEIRLSSEEIRLVGYFSRDLRELTESAFWKDGPGTLEGNGSFSSAAPNEPKLKTAVTDDELRSFVTIFRRLYMENEQANFLKAVAVFEKALSNHRVGKLVAGDAGPYSMHLQRPPWFPPVAPSGGFSFSSKRLIDVFIYTQYAHQPKPDRERQFADCLYEVGGGTAVLTWLFLGALHTTSLRINNAGKYIVWWFNRYCEHHQITPAILASILDDNPGIGSQEKEADKRARIFHEKAEQLANAMWQEKGCPAGGATQFLVAAQRDLRSALGEQGLPPSQ